MRVSSLDHCTNLTLMLFMCCLIKKLTLVVLTRFNWGLIVARNVSSDGLFARKQLRECDGLLESLLKVTHSVIGRAEMGELFIGSLPIRRYVDKCNVPATL